MNAGNLSEILNSGRFALFFEANLNADSCAQDAEFRDVDKVVHFVNNSPHLAGLAMVDEGLAPSSPSIETVVPETIRKTAKDVLVYLSGRDFSGERLTQTLRAWHAAGLRAPVMVSGNAKNLPVGSRSAARASQSVRHADSCQMLAQAQALYADGFQGATVNPFKYTLNDTFLQYFKLIRKLRCGARFLVVQAGWDMKKYQELQWFMRQRDLDDPAIARIVYLHPREIAAISEGKRPGIIISHQLSDLLKKESLLNPTQALTAQMQRLALQAVGCKFLGYSGVQLSGLPDARTAELVVQTMVDTLAELQSYKDWLTAWDDFHDRCEMAPMPYHYYLYEGLLDKENARHDDARPLAIQGRLTELDSRRKMGYLLREFLAMKRNGAVNKVCRHYLLREGEERLWHYGATRPWLERHCPKGLTEGACGGSQPDGTCEFGHRPCVFHEVLALAHWQHAIDELEKP